MTGIGTMINAGAIIVGGVIGILFKKVLTEKIQDSLLKVSGVSVLFLGIGGALAEMFTVEDGKITAGGSLMMILSLVLGTVLGEIIGIEEGFEKFGRWLKKVTKSDGDASFLNGFMTASLTVSIGAMAIVGPIKDGISGDYSVLVAKAILDFVIVMIMASSMGKGCVFSAIPVAVLQGAITVLAKFVEPILTESAITNLSYVGSVIIFCVGLNLVFGKKIKVANILPAIILAAAFSYIM